MTGHAHAVTGTAAWWRAYQGPDAGRWFVSAVASAEDVAWVFSALWLAVPDDFGNLVPVRREYL